MLPISEALAVNSREYAGPVVADAHLACQCGDTVSQREKFLQRRFAARFFGVGKHHHLVEHDLFGFARRRRSGELFLPWGGLKCGL